MTKAHDWKPHVAYLFCHESFLALVCIYTVCPSCFAQCVAGSTVGFLCFLFVVLYQVVTTGWTDFKKKEQEPRIMLTIRGAGMKNVLLCVTLLRSENYCIQHPHVSNMHCGLAGYLQSNRGRLWEWPHPTLPLQMYSTRTGLCKLTIEGVWMTCSFCLYKLRHLQLAIQD